MAEQELLDASERVQLLHTQVRFGTMVEKTHSLKLKTTGEDKLVIH